KAVDHGNARHAQRFEAIDHRVRPGNRGLDGLRIGGATKLIDIGPRNEAGFFRRANDKSGRPLAFQLGKNLVELLHDLGRERVGAGVFAVEQQPGDAVGIAGQLEIAIRARCLWLRPEREHAVIENVQNPRFHHHTASINIAPPCPPPMHSVAMPRRVPSRFIVLIRCSTMRLPEVPTGWPRLIAPPSTLSFDRSIWPAAPSRPSTSLQNFSSFHAARQPSTCVAKASFNSQVSMSCKVRSLRFRSAVADITGPNPMMDGSSAAHWLSRITAFGCKPCLATASSEARITHDAPSVICEEFPAVTCPHGRSKTGRNFASVSCVESGRTPSSWS